MKLTKKLGLALGSVLLASSLSGCAYIDKFLSDAEENWKGKSMTIQSYDDDSNIIDKVHGKSISLSPDSTFDKTNESGETISESSVINFTVGGKQMLQVGSTIIAYEDGLTNIYDSYAKTLDVKDTDRSIPVLNRMLNNYENAFKGKAMVVVIRNQTGKLVGVFSGNEVSYFASDISKATEFLIDGKLLFVYRANMAVYDKDILEKE